MSPRCGLLGTITSDAIETADGRSHQAIGGILYQAVALCGFGVPAALFSNCGESLRPDVEAIVGGWPSLDRDGLIYVPGPGHRVRLHYPGRSKEREEVLESVVPPLDPGPVLERLPELDFLLMALNSGVDVSLSDWKAIVGRAACPIWLDIHSLALTPVAGVREYRAIPEWREWIEGAAYLQANRQEIACLMGRPQRPADETDIGAFSVRAFELGLRAVFVTMGEGGALVATPGEIRRLPAPPAPAIVDPTGCGDVFAAAAVAGLLQGWTVFEAAAAGVDLASRAVGVSGLRETFHLAARARTDGFFDLSAKRGGHS